MRRTIREVLMEFQSVRIPTEYIFDVFPLLSPRQFSIASSAKVSNFISVSSISTDRLSSI